MKKTVTKTVFFMRSGELHCQTQAMLLCRNGFFDGVIVVGLNQK